MLGMLRVKKSAGKINIRGRLLSDEPMAAHTTYRVGGPADLYAVPADSADLASLLRFCHSQGIEPFILGGGANILVSDRGIRGLVIDMTQINRISINNGTLEVGAGLAVSDAAAWCADRGWAGLHFLYSMPGSVGGAVWMNARCYDGEIYEVLRYVDQLHPDGSTTRYLPRAEDFDYKISPFQTANCVIVDCGIALTAADRDTLWQQMQSYRADRESKGHFTAPSAGSVFKNNRAFGSPSGTIIDRLGLRGQRIGGAQVSERHANIIVNTGNATACDIDRLATLVAERVEQQFGFTLEREVLKIGEW